MSIEPQEYLETKFNRIDIPDEEKYIAVYSGDNYVCSTHDFLVSASTTQEYSLNGLQKIKNMGDGHCFYHAVLRYILSTPTLMQLKIKGTGKPLAELLGFTNPGTYEQDIKNILESQTCLMHKKKPTFPSAGMFEFGGNIEWTEDECKKELYEKIYLLRTILIKFLIEFDKTNLSRLLDYTNEGEEIYFEFLQYIKNEGGVDVDNLITRIKTTQSHFLKGAMKALLQSRLSEKVEEITKDEPYAIYATDDDISLMSAMLRTNIYIQGTTLEGTKLKEHFSVYTRDRKLYSYYNIVLYNGSEVAKALTSLKDQPSLFLFHKNGDHYDTYLPDPSDSKSPENQGWLTRAFNYDIGAKISPLNEIPSPLPSPPAPDPDADNFDHVTNTYIEAAKKQQNKEVEKIEAAFSNLNDPSSLETIKEYLNKAKKNSIQFEKKIIEKAQIFNADKGGIRNKPVKSSDEITETIRPLFDSIYAQWQNKLRTLGSQYWGTILKEPNKVTIAQIKSEGGLKQFLIDLEELNVKLVMLDKYVKNRLERAKHVVTAPVRGTRKALAAVNSSNNKTVRARPATAAKASGPVIAAAPAAKAPVPGSGPAPVIAAVPGSGPAPAANVPVMAASSAKAATNPSVASVASGEATSGEEEQQPSLLDLVKNGTIDDIAPLITETLNKNEQIGKNGETYLDFAAYRVKKNCNLARALGRSPDCLAKIKIYNYLKEEGFIHSDKYTNEDLKEFMKFMIQKLQFLNYDTPENSIQLKKLFNGVVLKYIENNKQMDLDKKDPYVDEEYKVDLANLANIKFTLSFTGNNKLTLLGFTPDMITDLKNSASAAPEPDTSNPAQPPAPAPSAAAQSATTPAATTPAETQPAAIVATTPEAASAQQKPIRKSNNQQVAVVQEIKKQRKEAGLEDEEGKPSEIQEIYEAVENMDDEGKNNGELLNEVVETKIESLITKIANFYAQDNHYSVVGNEKVLSVYLETKYKFTYDGTKKTKIYDYVLSKSESADPPLNKTQKDQLSLVMVTLLRNMGWKKSQAKLGTYVNDYGLRPPGNWDSLSKQLIELPMGNDKRNWKLQSTEKYVPMIANMRDSNFDQQLEQLNTLIRSKLSGIKDSKKQGLKISYLNRVKAEIEKIPQGSLSQDNINTLKMTIMVWKVLSMTPVQGNLPDENLVKSVGEGNDSDFSTNLNSIMKVLDDDEKEDYVTGKSRSGDGNLYLLGFIDSDADEPETPTQSLLDLIKSSTDMVESIRAQFKDDSQFQDDITRELVSTGSSVQPGDGSSDGSSDGSVPQRGFMGFHIGDYFPTGLFGLTGQTPKSEEGDERSSVGSDYDDDEEKNSVGSTASVGGGRKLRKTKKKKANKKKNRKTRSKKSKNQRKKK
jgi:hypothetical protein